VEETNRRIVSLLSRDGRMSFTELARQTGLSVSAAQQRVRRLEDRGVIRGYAALVNPDDAGLPLTAFVSIKPFDPAAPDDAPQRLAHLPAIEACHSVAGDESYILKVRVASPVALEDLLQEMVGQVWEVMVAPAQVAEVQARHVVSRMVRAAAGVRLRLLAPVSPYPGAVQVAPDLEDAYLGIVRGLTAYPGLEQRAASR